MTCAFLSATSATGWRTAATGGMNTIARTSVRKECTHAQVEHSTRRTRDAASATSHVTNATTSRSARTEVTRSNVTSGHARWSRSSNVGHVIRLLASFNAFPSHGGATDHVTASTEVMKTTATKTTSVSRHMPRAQCLNYSVTYIFSYRCLPGQFMCVNGTLNRWPFNGFCIAQRDVSSVQSFWNLCIHILSLCWFLFYFRCVMVIPIARTTPMKPAAGKVLRETVARTNSGQ